MWQALVGPIIKGFDNILGKVIGDKGQREQADHEEQMTVMEQYAAEYGIRENRTKWDSFVDGLNRLPRPVMTFGIIGVFWYCIKYPADFALSMEALKLMPEYGWALMGTIVTFWFGGKFLGSLKKPLKAPDPEQVERVLDFYKRMKENATQERKEQEGS